MATETKTRERPILFSGPLVRAILAGRKTQTRRVVRPQFGQLWGSGVPHEHGFRCLFKSQKWRDAFGAHVDIKTPDGWLYVWCPFGKAGDRLWVRETFALETNYTAYDWFPDQRPPFDDGRPLRWSKLPAEDGDGEYWEQPHYRATDPTPELAYDGDEDEPTVRWRPSIFLPRWASRITLEITRIRIEQLQEITPAAVRAEGFDHPPDELLMRSFQQTWDTLNAKRGFGWTANPWVWVIEFVMTPDARSGGEQSAKDQGPMTNVQ